MADRNNLYEILQEKKRVLIGSLPIRLPVYILQLQYMSKDNDPFFNLDKAILRYIQIQPNTNIGCLANLLGMNPDFIRFRIGFLQPIMIRTEENGSYKVTEDAERKYFNENGARPDVSISADLMVDGRTLSLLPTIFYDRSNRVWLYDGKTNIPHKALLTKDAPILRSTISKLNSLPADSLTNYNLEKLGHDFQLINLEPKYIIGAQITFSYDSAGKVCKELLFADTLIEVEALGSDIQNYLFMINENGEVISNGGFSSRDDASEFVVDFNFKYLDLCFQRRYGATEIIREDYEYDGKGFPIIGVVIKVNVSINLYERVTNKRALLADAEKGILELPVKGGGFMLVKVEICEDMRELIDTERAIESWKKEHNWGIDYSFIETYLPPECDWRLLFIRLKRFDELEEIDRVRYFKGKLNQESEDV